MCQEHKDLFSPSFLSWRNSPLTVSAFVWPRFSAAGVGIKARKKERDTRASSTATGISHYLHPVKNCPISSLDKTRREFKNITWKHTPQIPESLLLFLYHSPEPLRIRKEKKRKGNYLQWKGLKEGKMLRFHFWCTIDRSVISGGFYSIMGSRCWNTQRVREGNRVLPKIRESPTAGSSIAASALVLLGPIVWTDRPCPRRWVLPECWVWPECPDSADPSAVSPLHLPSPIPSWSPCCTPHCCPWKLSITLQNPLCAPHSVPSSLIFLAHSMTPFEFHLFFIKSSP